MKNEEINDMDRYIENYVEGRFNYFYKMYNKNFDALLKEIQNQKEFI